MTLYAKKITMLINNFGLKRWNIFDFDQIIIPIFSGLAMCNFFWFSTGGRWYRFSSGNLSYSSLFSPQMNWICRTPCTFVSNGDALHTFQNDSGKKSLQIRTSPWIGFPPRIETCTVGGVSNISLFPCEQTYSDLGFYLQQFFFLALGAPLRFMCLIFW